MAGYKDPNLRKIKAKVSLSIFSFVTFLKPYNDLAHINGKFFIREKLNRNKGYQSFSVIFWNYRCFGHLGFFKGT